jgi:hypothetical protein
MKNIRFISLFIIFLICQSLALAQTFQPPEIEFAPDLSELRGKSRVFVYAEDLSARSRIVKELLKYERLTIAERVEDCDFIIAFGASVLPTAVPPGYENPQGGTQLTLVKEMVALRFVRLEGARLRPRVIWHTRATKTTYSFTVPLQTSTANLFAPKPRSAKGAGIELGLRLFFFWFQKKRSRGFAFDQLNNQASISFGRDPEVKAARAFVKALKKVDKADAVIKPSQRLPDNVRRPLVSTDLAYGPHSQLIIEPATRTPRNQLRAERPRRVKRRKR